MNQLVDLAVTKSLPSDRQFYVGEEELIRVFHLSWREAQFLQVLLVYSVGGPDVFPELKRPRQYIHVLRKKLKVHGIEINSCGGEHYTISFADRTRILETINSNPPDPQA
jgi:hypothetical protein